MRGRCPHRRLGRSSSRRRTQRCTQCPHAALPLTLTLSPRREERRGERGRGRFSTPRHFRRTGGSGIRAVIPAETLMKKTYRIAVIPGDGIGKEVVPEGVRVLEAAAKRHWLRPHARLVRFRLRGLLRKARPHDAGGLESADRRPRRDLLRRGRLARQGAGPRLAVGLAGAVPPRVRPVRQPAPGPADARRRRAPLAGRKVGDIDFYVVRENTEGEYSAMRRADVRRHRARIRRAGNRL